MQKNRSAIDYFEVGIVKKKIEETKENREKTKHRKRNGRDWDKREQRERERKRVGENCVN